jgi:Arc/MetJ family transcription regulator
MGAHVEIDEALLRKAMKATGLASGPATVEEALRRLIDNQKLRSALDDIRGLGWDGDLDASRQGWFPDQER